jgi:hypothetical protein
MPIVLRLRQRMRLDDEPASGAILWNYLFPRPLGRCTEKSESSCIIAMSKENVNISFVRKGSLAFHGIEPASGNFKSALKNPAEAADSWLMKRRPEHALRQGLTCIRRFLKLAAGVGD